MEPEFQPYGLPHLTVIFLTIVLPFALAAIVWRTKSRRTEKIIVGMLSAVLVLNYVVYLIFIRSRGITTWQQMLPMQLCDWGMVVVIVAMWTGNLAIHQLFHLTLRYYHRRGLPDVDSTIPAISHVDRARVPLVGVLFSGYLYHRQIDRF